MKKSFTQAGLVLPPFTRKLLLMVKITCLLLLAFLQVSASGYSQKRINVSFNNTNLEKVLHYVERQSDYVFYYNNDEIEKLPKVNLQLSEVTVPQLLDSISAKLDIHYNILDGKLIVLAPKNTLIQDTKVSGTVTDSSTGQPLIGVTIKVQGNNSGTVTDADGNYDLAVPDNAVLEVSYVGYRTKTIPVSGQSTINIQLATAANELSQVVVVGYGTQQQKDVTGAVSVVSSKDIENRPIINSGEALQGKAAGVQVISNSGKPGSGLTVRVRGSSSISAGNEPLYVVDGIPTTDISYINPEDIASISVLKDAASSAIYGTRAANGVVVITTKKGTAGKSNISASVYYGVTSPTKRLSVLNARQYQDYANEQKGSTVITDSMVQANDINWPDQVFQTGNQQNYQLSISGGSEKTQHYISLNYTDQVGMIKPASYDRASARINLSTETTNWLKFTTSTFIARSHNNGVTDNASVARGGVVLSALETPPTVPKYNADSTIGYNALTGWENPLGAIEGSYNKDLNDHLLSNLGADITFFKGLVFKSRFGIDYQNYQSTYFLDPFLTIYGRQTQGQQNRTKGNNLTWLSEETLNYEKSWGKSHLTALAGWTAQKSHTEETYISGSFLKQQYRLLPWDESYLRDSVKAPGTTSVDEWALKSYLGRITYNFNDKYLFQANIRSDQSSKFAPGNRVATFPSFSAGWRISQEDFMNNIPIINDLKLRAGWGQNGNQEGIGSYQYLPLSDIDPVTGAVTASTIAPASLTWETSTQTDVGLDAVILNDRLSFSADFYIKKTKDVLINIPLPSQAGFATAPVNAASMKNVGEEFMISSKNIVNGDLKWNTTLNLSFNQNTIETIGEGINFMNAYGSVYARGNAIALVKGYGLGEFYGYVAEGVDPQTGHELYLTSDGKTTDNPAPSDRKLIGNAQPDFVYGLTNDLAYKNLSLTVFIQGSQGNKIFNAGRLEAEAMVNSANQSAAVVNRWKQAGDVTNIPGVSMDGTTNNSLISTRFLEDGSYMRFKTITLTYNFNPDLISKLGLGALSVYVSGNNLITFTKYKGFDPEVNSYGNPSNDNDSRNISLGLDNGAYPQAKMFLVGLNVSLK